MRLLALSLLTIGLLQAQFTGLIAPGDGVDLYYGIGVGPPYIGPRITLSSSGAIYKIGSQPASLVIALPPSAVSGPQFIGHGGG